MARLPRAFKQSGVQAALKAVLAAGREPVRVEIDSITGKIVIVIREDTATSEPATDFDKWKKAHARQS